MKIIKLLLLSFIGITIMNSCSKDELQIPAYTPLGSYDSGVLVLNEGGFGSSNASLSFISFDLNSNQNNIFQTVNPSVILGDTAQNIGFNDQLAYIIVNGSNKIEIVNRYTMTRVATISSGLNNPRYIAFANGKAYVTNWGAAADTTDDFVAVINLTSNVVSKSIPVVEGPERILSFANNLYVSHKGGYGFGNSLTVLNASTDNITTTIAVGALPNTMQINNGSLWVLSEGYPSYATNETSGVLQKINLSTNTITDTYNFSGTNTHPSYLEIYNNKIYYMIGSDVFQMPTTPIAPATSINLPLTPIFNAISNSVYGFGVKNNKIYVANAGNFTSNGSVKIFSLGEITGSPALGTLLKTVTVGVAPNGFYFNQ